MLALLPLAAGAQPRPQPTPIPDPKPRFGPIAYLIGTWSCRAGLAGGPSHPLTTEYTWILDGRWIHEHTVSPAHDSSRSFAYLYDSNTGYDTARKHWVSIGSSNTQSYTISYAPVAADGTLAFTDTTVLGGKMLHGHSTWTKVSATEMRMVGSDSTGAHYVQRCVKIAR